jgi:hypothetical protein
LQVTITDHTAGTLYIDNVLFGFSTEKQPLPSKIATVGQSQLDVRVVNNRLSVKADVDNPVRKVELIDMQGRTVYSQEDINRPEYSFDLSPYSGFFIARIQSANGVSAKKIVID